MVSKCFVGVCGWAVVLLLAPGSVGATDEGDLGLVQAARNRDTAAVKALLGQGAEVDETEPDGATALHWAAYRDDDATVEVLVRAGANANAVNDYGVTPLWLACQNGSAAVVERLLKSGADPNIAHVSGVTPLMAASRVGGVAAVRELLGHGAEVNAREGKRWQTALMWAVAQRHGEVARALIEGGADVHARSRLRRMTVNTGIAANGPIAWRREAPPHLVERDEGGYTPLLFAARNGDVEVARILLAGGANVNDVAPAGTSALVVAIHSGHYPLGRFLLDRGADPNAAGAGYTALHAAILRGSLEAASALLAHGADPNAVLKNGTPQRRNSDDYALWWSFAGATPLWLAARYLEPDIMRLLVANGANPEVGKERSTRLIAVSNGLSGHGRSGDSQRALTLTQVEKERALEGVRLVLQLGADVNAADEQGDTALHKAASRGLDRVAQLLVENGAKLDATNSLGETPLAMTYTKVDVESGGQLRLEHKSTRELLSKLGAIK